MGFYDGRGERCVAEGKRVDTKVVIWADGEEWVWGKDDPEVERQGSGRWEGVGRHPSPRPFPVPFYRPPDRSLGPGRLGPPNCSVPGFVGPLRARPTHTTLVVESSLGPGPDREWRVDVGSLGRRETGVKEDPFYPPTLSTSEGRTRALEDSDSGVKTPEGADSLPHPSFSTGRPSRLLPPRVCRAGRGRTRSTEGRRRR